MADEIDHAQDREQATTGSAVAYVRAQAAKIKEGTTGDCDLCGEYFARIVNGACGRCRDKFNLP